MEKGGYIKSLRSTSQAPHKETNLEQTPNEQKNIELILEGIRDLKIAGDKKRLIKIDEKNGDFLKILSPVFSVDVTRVINFLIARFIEEHPELIKEIKQSLKDLYHELD